MKSLEVPVRKERLSENIEAILNQSYKFSKLVINVDDDLGEDDYAWYLSLKDKDKRIEINKCEKKWRSCNKLLPTLKKYPEDVIITLDDDIYYPKDTVKLLVDEYKKNKDCIIAHEVNPIVVLKKEKYVNFLNAYDIMLMQREWGKYFSNCCLFPPHTFDGSDLYDYDKMMECTNGTHDELWFWVNSTINGVMCIGLNYVKSFATEMLRPYDKGEYCLTDFNNTKEKIKGYMDKINNMYGERLLSNILAKPTVFTVNKDNIYAFMLLFPKIKSLYNYGCHIKTDGLTKAWIVSLKKCLSEK